MSRNEIESLLLRAVADALGVPRRGIPVANESTPRRSAGGGRRLPDSRQGSRAA
jgi:hypothetical protein